MKNTKLHKSISEFQVKEVHEFSKASQLSDSTVRTIITGYRDEISAYTPTNLFYQWLCCLEGNKTTTLPAQKRHLGDQVQTVSFSAYAYQLASFKVYEKKYQNKHILIAFPKLMRTTTYGKDLRPTQIKTMRFEVRKGHKQPKRVKNEELCNFMVRGKSDHGFISGLFGYHLVSSSTKKVYIFESEKTAVAYHAVKYKGLLVDLKEPNLETVYLAVGSGHLNALQMLQIKDMVSKGIDVILCGDVENNIYGRAFDEIDSQIQLKEILAEIDTVNLDTIVAIIKEARIVTDNPVKLALLYSDYSALDNPKDKVTFCWSHVTTKRIKLCSRTSLPYLGVCPTVYDTVLAGTTHKDIHLHKRAEYGFDWLDILLTKD